MCPCSGFTVPSQQPVNCIVRVVDHGVTEKPEFDTASQSSNLLLKRERKSRGGRERGLPCVLSMDLWSWPGGTSNKS